MRLRPARLESRFTKQMSQLCPILSAPSFRRHSSLSLLLGRFGPLYRFNGSSGPRRNAVERETDRQTETERQRTRSKRNRGRKTKSLYFTSANKRGELRNEERRRETGKVRRGWKGPRAPREGAWWGVVKFVKGWFLLNLYFINYVPESRAHPGRGARAALASFIPRGEIF